VTGDNRVTSDRIIGSQVTMVPLEIAAILGKFAPWVDGNICGEIRSL
jgi:hypothetical protein